MACQIERMGGNNVCVCNTTAEAAECTSALDRADDTGWNAVANFGMDVAGGIKDAAYGFAMFGPDVARYATGTDAYLGERQPWRRIGRNLNLDNNTFHFEPVAAIADTVNSMVYGGFDMLLGHAPNYIVNDLLGLNFRYFHPQAKSARGFVGELATIGLMMAGGQFVKAIRGEPPVPVAAVSYGVSPLASLKGDIAAASKAVKDARRALSEAGCSEAGFADVSLLHKMISKIRGGKKAVSPPEQSPKLLSSDMLSIKWDLAEGVESFMRKVVDTLVKKGVEGDVKAIRSAQDMAAKYPQAFNPRHISALVKALKENAHDGAYDIIGVLKTLAEAMPELFGWEHMEPLMVSTRRSRDTLYVMDKLAGKRPELFSVDDVDVVAKVAATSEYGIYYGPRPTIENIVNLKMNIVDIMIANVGKEGRAVISNLIKLAEKRPAIIPQVVTGLLKKGDPSNWPLAKFVRAFGPELFPADLVAKMLDAAKQGNKDASLALVELAQRGSELTLRIIDSLIDALRAKINDNGALDALIYSNPKLFSAEQIASLIDIAKANGDSVWVLGRLVRQRPELAPQIIPFLQEAAKTDQSARTALFFLREQNPELFE
jgi:hypothetical protein